MSIPKDLKGILVSTRATLGGRVRFVDTRVPVEALLDAVTCGHSVDYFLEGFPNVKREHALAVLRWEQNIARETFGLERVA